MLRNHFQSKPTLTSKTGQAQAQHTHEPQEKEQELPPQQAQAREEEDQGRRLGCLRLPLSRWCRR